MVKVFNGKEFVLIDGAFVSRWQVLQTKEGFYLGSTMLVDDEEMPFERYTGYFNNKEDGESVIEELYPASL